MNTETITGKDLKTYRTLRGATLEEVAEVLEITKQRLSAIESSARVRPERSEQIANAVDAVTQTKLRERITGGVS